MTKEVSWRKTGHQSCTEYPVLSEYQTFHIFHIYFLWMYRLFSNLKVGFSDGEVEVCVQLVSSWHGFCHLHSGIIARYWNNIFLASRCRDLSNCYVTMRPIMTRTNMHTPDVCRARERLISLTFCLLFIVYNWFIFWNKPKKIFKGIYRSLKKSYIFCRSFFWLIIPSFIRLSK